MNTFKRIAALILLSSQALNAVWYNPFTWFSSSEEQDEQTHESTCSDHHCRRCN